MDSMYNTDLGISGFRIKAFIITLMNNNTSVVAARKLLWSIDSTGSKVQPFLLNATTPETIKKDIENSFSKELVESIYSPATGLRWTWPVHSSQDGIDFATGLHKKAYTAADQKKVMACAISHMRLWQHCIDINQPIMVLEHDAIFLRRFDYKAIVMCGEKKEDGDYYDNVEGAVPENHMVHMHKLQVDSHNGNTTDYTGQFTGGIMGLNNPIGATRKSKVFDQKVQQLDIQSGKPTKYGISQVPYVDEIGDIPLPSGLAGNSAYIIKPWAAKKLIEKVKEVGVWPNDALMCRQFFPWLQVYFPYYTTVQRTASTTTL
jgi:GR25 family glycosyltransferase involved in LPS biosynthesis